MTLHWSGVTGATGYNIYRGTATGGEDYSHPVNGTTLVTTQDTGPGVTNMFMYSDTGLTNETEYFYTVKAVYAAGESVASSEDNNVPDPNSIPWDTGNPNQVVSGMLRLLTNTLPPDNFANPYTPDIGFLSIGGPDGVVYQGNIPDGSPPRAVAASGHYNATAGTIDYTDGSSLPAPSDGDDGVGGQAAPVQPSGVQPYVVQNPPVYSYPAYTPAPTGIYRKIETQPGYSGFRALVGLPIPGDTGLVLNTSGSYQDSAYIYTGGSLFVNPAQNYRGGSTLAMDIGLQLGHSNPTTNPGWVPFIFYAGCHLFSTREML